MPKFRQGLQKNFVQKEGVEGYPDNYPGIIDKKQSQWKQDDPLILQLIY